jgi:SSS family solute:Na+ symporter
LLGLFLLGILSSSVRSIHAALGVVAGVAVILWMTFSNEWSYLRSPFHNLLPIVFGTLAIMIVGFAASRLPSIFRENQRQRHGEDVELR